jgi:excisionase family DNA binding protein
MCHRDSIKTKVELLMRTKFDENDLLEEGAMRIDEAVAWSGIGRSMLYKLMAQGAIPSVHAGGRRLIPRRGLRIYLASRVDEGTI